MGINQQLIEKYKNDPVLIKTYYADAKNQLLTGIINPLKIDNRQLMAPTDNQRDIPACAGYSACTLVESIYWKQTGKLIQLEAQQVYAKAKQIDGNVNMEGTYLESSLQAAIMLTDIDTIKNAKIETFYNNRDLNTIETTKFLLHKYDFLQVGFQIDDGWYNCNQENYILRRGSRKLGGHAVNICGVDQSGFYILNQWGTEWGTKGYAIMPFDLFLQEFMYGAYLVI